MNEFILFYFRNIYYFIYIHMFPKKKIFFYHELYTYINELRLYGNEKN